MDDHEPLPQQRDIQTALVEPPTLVGQLAQIDIIVLGRTVTHTLAIGIDDSVRPPLAHRTAVIEVSKSFPPRDGGKNIFAEKS